MVSRIRQAPEVASAFRGTEGRPIFPGMATMDLSREKSFLGYKKRTFHITGASAYKPATSESRTLLRWAGGLSIVVHSVLLWISWPGTVVVPEVVHAPRALYVVRSVRFAPPRPAVRLSAPKPTARRIPIPDPTPDEPEPLRFEEELELDLDIEDADFEFVLGGLGDGPPGLPGPPGLSGEPGAGGGSLEGVFEVGGGVLGPRKLHSPQPLYTDEAREDRIQGIVLLRAVVDEQGNVTRVEVLKSLNPGLDRSAIETVETWKYEPATRDGEPVAVYMHLTIGFWLQ